MNSIHAVDGRNPANQLRSIVYPIIDTVLYIPGAGFLPSTVILVLGTKAKVTETLCSTARP